MTPERFSGEGPRQENESLEKERAPQAPSGGGKDNPLSLESFLSKAVNERKRHGSAFVFRKAGPIFAKPSQ